MKKTLILILIFMVALSLGCFKKQKREKLADELAAEAMEQFDDKRYRSAIETFNQLRDWYPFDKLSTLAEFKIAESHFKMKDYEEAIMAYEEFEQLHPRNEAISYVLNQIALSYYNRLDTVDRDQSNAKNALKAFSRLARQFPESDYAKQAGDKHLDCIKSIAGHEIYIGRFYYKSKHYKSAIARFETVLSKFSGLGFDQEAREFIEKSREKIIVRDKTGKDKIEDREFLPE